MLLVVEQHCQFGRPVPTVTQQTLLMFVEGLHSDGPWWTMAHTTAESWPLMVEEQTTLILVGIILWTLSMH